MLEVIVSGVILGLMGSGHCVAMCGGIISSLSVTARPTLETQNINSIPISNLKQNKNNWLAIFLYQVGRISSYTIAGLLVGVAGNLFGTSVEDLTSIPLLKIFSALLIILMGLNISRIPIGKFNIENIGKYLWNVIKPYSRHFLPVDKPYKALLLGGVWGWLPCGLVYTSLGYAAATADSLSSATFMFSFGLGTLPSTLLISGMSMKIKKLLNNLIVIRITGAIFVIIGAYMLINLIGNPSAHMHH
ncbi:MAG: cytochrome biogenesis protein [Gammaproteobacteria bacterium]|nr:MAG: cytochrome biogenesis protein [Gammaproteobacteria bacterium]